MNTMVKRTVTLAVLAAMIACLVPFLFGEETYAAVKLSKKSIVIGKGQTAKLKVKGTKKKVKWSSTKKSIATVTKKGVVKGKKIGSCYIKAKVGGKTLKCKVAVKKPAVANAINLRKYILSKGKKGTWDDRTGFAIGWSDAAEGEPYRKVARVCAFKNTTEMYFELHVNADDEWSTVRMWIDLAKEKTGRVIYHQDSENYNEEECNDVAADIDIKYDGTLDTLSNVNVGNYVWGSDDAKSSAVAGVNTAFGCWNKTFKKAKLSSTMKKIGFAKWAA